VAQMDAVPRYMLKQKPVIRNIMIISTFVIGGGVLYFVAHPFLVSMLALAVSLGVSQFVFVQWVAPFLSEFPEKVSAFKWASTIDNAPVALMNMVSSNINQWTVLIAMIPPTYALGLGHFEMIRFDTEQQIEIFLTISQSLLAFTLLANMEFAWYEALGIFGLWLIQFIIPSSHLVISLVYLLWVLGYWVTLYIVHRITGESTCPLAFHYFGEIVGEYVFLKRMAKDTKL
jgi:cation:H+ antiporter